MPDDVIETEDFRGHRVQKLLDNADKILEDATSAEALKGNPYVGKPLSIDANPYEGANYWSHRILKNAGFTLPWIELEREIGEIKAALPERAAAHARWLEAERIELNKLHGERFVSRRRWLLDRQAKFEDALRDEIDALRAKINRFNIEVPIIDRQMVGVKPERYWSRLEPLWAAALQQLRDATQASSAPEEKAGSPLGRLWQRIRGE